MAAMVPMSSMSGTLVNSSGSSVRRAAAMTGRAAFLLPEIATSPVSRPPPVMRSRSIAPTVHDRGAGESSLPQAAPNASFWSEVTARTG